MKKALIVVIMAILWIKGASGSEWQGIIDGSGQTKSEPVVTLGVFTDTHYSATKPDKAGRNYMASKQKVEEAVEVFNAKNVDMVLSLGDIVDNEFDDYADIAQYLNRLKMPFHTILGNHDFIVPFSIQQQNNAFKTLGVTDRYFSIVKENVRLIFLDTSDIAMYSNAEESKSYCEAEAILAQLKEACAVNARNYNGAIGTTQMQWLEEQLNEATQASENVVCFSHIPLFVKDGERYTLWNGDDIGEMLKKNTCVKSYIAGHHHVGGYSDAGGIHHIVMKGMVQGPENSFAIISIYQDRIVIDGYGREDDREYKFR